MAAQIPLVMRKMFREFYYEFDENKDMWRVDEMEDRNGHAWYFNKESYPHIEDCIKEIDDCVDFQFYLKYTLEDPKNKLEQALENYAERYRKRGQELRMVRYK